MNTAMASYIGTSGWSYPSGYGKWTGVVYPKGLHGDELSYYAERFPAVEVNVSFYRIPSPDTVRGWLQRTPDTFRFAVKLYRKFTHPEFYQRAEGKSPTIMPEDVDAMRRVFDPLADQARLGAVLVQYPDAHRQTPEHAAQLVRTLDYFKEYPLAVEFRHLSWSDPSIEAILTHFNASRVRVDEPLFSNLRDDSHTGRVDYWRFHGRNAAAWQTPGSGNLRYDYNYSRDEIDDIADAILQQPLLTGRDRMMFFNNHLKGQAVANAVALGSALKLPLPFTKFSHLSAQFPEIRQITGSGGGVLTFDF